jgi:hypothetical protein
MKIIRPFLKIFMPGVLLLSACAPLLPIQPAPSPTPPSGGSQTVTLEDQGRKISLAIGDEFLLKLGEGYNWDVAISDQAVLSRVIGIAVIRGAQGLYAAHKAGTVSLDATGDPQCRQSKPACAMPSLKFNVTVTVTVK